MDHNRVREVITTAALAAGLPEGRVLGTPSAADNLTLKRPRLEVDILPESYSRTGRKLTARRRDARQTVKKELYSVRLEVTCHVLAEDEAWLTAFCRDFLAKLPRGFNDDTGNYVKLAASEASFSTPPAKRMGKAEIKVFSRADTLLHLIFTWRVTTETERALIENVNLNAPTLGEGSNHHGDEENQAGYPGTDRTGSGSGTDAGKRV